MGLAMLLACGVAGSAVDLTHESTDLVRHNYFRLSPQASAVGGDGKLHVFARDSGLVERRLDPGGWVEESVDPYVGAGKDLSASIGPDGVMHVLYQITRPCGECTTPGFLTTGLRYARKGAGAWQITDLSATLKELLLVSNTRAITAGDGGTLDVLGFGAEGTALGLFHSHFDGSAWSHQMLLDTGSSNGRVGLSRAADGSLHGTLLRSFADGTERLYYFGKAPGGAWQTRVIKDYSNMETIQPFAGIVATDGSTADILVSAYSTLHHYRVTPGAVDEFVVNNAGQPFNGSITYPALVAASGQPLTAAFNVTANSNVNQDWYELWVARFNGVSWLPEKVYGTGMAGSGTPVPSLVDPPQVHYVGGVLHVLNKETGFFNEVPGDVQPVSDWSKPLAAWERSTVIQSQAGISVPGKQIVAAADAQGRIHALHFADTLDSFSMFEGGHLMYAAETDGSPISELIPRGAGHMGAEGLAIAVAPDGTVHGIAEGFNFIRHVARDGGTWTVDDITTPFNHVDRSRMAMTLDAGEHVHACLYENVFVNSQEQVRLRYLTNATGTWAQESIVALMGPAPVGQRYMSCAIRVLGDGSIHVAYVNTDGDLRKATRGSGTWSDVEVAAQTTLGLRQQIAPLLDADGYVHASFTQLVPFGPSYVPNGIRYGTNRGVIWAEELVDDDVQLGIEVDYFYRAEIDDYSPLYRSSIAQTPDGNIHLFYYDEGLYFARGSVRVGGAWRNIPVDVTESSGPYGDVVALPDNTTRYVYAVERTGAVRTTASVPGPALFLNGDLVFPRTTVGDSVTASFTVSNRGAQPLSLTDITVQSDSYTLLPGGTCSSSTVLQTGQACTLLIKYDPAPFETQPTTSNERLGLLLIESNDPWSAVGYRLEGMTDYPGSGGGGGGSLPGAGSAGLLMLALLRRRLRSGLCQP